MANGVKTYCTWVFFSYSLRNVYSLTHTSKQSLYNEVDDLHYVDLRPSFG